MGKEFARSEGIRVQVTNEQSQQIRKLYKELSDEYKERLRILSTKQTVSARIREQYLKDYVKDLERDMQYLNNNLENTITSNMLRVAEAVVDDSLKLDKEMGFGGIMAKQFYIPQDVVAIVTSGELYKGKWSLSGAIWSNNQKQLQTIDQIVAKGVAGNKSALEIAKDLERYVSPSSARQSRTVIYNKHEIDANGNRVIKRDAEGKPITGKYYFGKVDYNAQRLARTMVSHAYQESFVESTKDNPFIESYRWLASGGDRMCPVCEERDGQIYDKDSLPMDHPNGMCTFEAVIDLSYEEIGRKLADWVNGEGDPELNAQIDNYADSLGFNVKQMTAGTEQVRNAEALKAEEPVKAKEPVPVTLSETYDEALEEFRAKRAGQIEDLAPFEEMNKTLNDMIKNNDFNVRIPTDDATVIKSILEDGRLKTQFETGTSGGQLDTYVREKASHNLFNTPSDIDVKQYEKYGYLGSKDVTQDDKHNPQLWFYGEGIIKLKKEEMMDRTTVTVGDSLRDASDGRFIMGSKVTDVDSTVCVGRIGMIDEFNQRFADGISKYGINDASAVGYGVRSYIELQYHGDVTLKDVESMTIERRILEELKEDENVSRIAKESGIKFNYIEGDQLVEFNF